MISTHELAFERLYCVHQSWEVAGGGDIIAVEEGDVAPSSGSQARITGGRKSHVMPMFHDAGARQSLGARRDDRLRRIGRTIIDKDELYARGRVGVQAPQRLGSKTLYVVEGHDHRQSNHPGTLGQRSFRRGRRRSALRATNGISNATLRGGG